MTTTAAGVNAPSRGSEGRGRKKGWKNTISRDALRRVTRRIAADANDYFLPDICLVAPSEQPQQTGVLLTQKQHWQPALSIDVRQSHHDSSVLAHLLSPEVQ